MTHSAKQIGNGEFGDEPARADNEPTTFDNVALELRRNGYSPIPVHPLSKRPAVRGWNKPATTKQIRQWMQQFPTYNAGILGGPCVGFDIDMDDPDEAEELHALVLTIFGGDPLERWRGPVRRLLLYRAWQTAGTSHFDGFDIIGSKAQFVGFGTHLSGDVYRWRNGNPATRRLVDLPIATPVGQKALEEELERSLGRRRSGRRTLRAERDRASVPARQVGKGDLIMDGRDAELTSCVWHIRGTGVSDPHRIAQLAFTLFVSRVDITRPKRDGTAPWSLQDALEKALYLLKSGKVPPERGPLAVLTRDTIAPAFDAAAFNTAVTEICSLGDLPRAADRISRVMVEIATPSGVCFAAAKTIAKWLDLNEDTVTKQRSRLVAEGLWTRTYDAVKGCGTAEFRPQVTFALDRAQRVVCDATRKSSSWFVGKDEDKGSLEEQIRKNYVGFEFRELDGTIGGEAS